MKKVLLFLLVTLLAYACGDVAEVSEEPVEFGQTHEALVVEDAYGIDQLGNRCWLGSGATQWAGSMCRVPNGVRWTIVIPDANNTLGCDADARVGIGNAATYFKNHLNAMNWSVNVVTQTECPTCGTSAKTAVVQCKSSGAPSASTYGNTRMMEASTVACTCGDFCGGSCINGPGGKFVSVNSLPNGIELYKNNWLTQPWYTALTSTQKRQVVRNFAAHEMFHIAGLGHDTFAESPLMGYGQAGPLAGANSDLNPTSFEDYMLRCNNPNRNSLFPLNPSQCL